MKLKTCKIGYTNDYDSLRIRYATTYGPNCEIKHTKFFENAREYEQRIHEHIQQNCVSLGNELYQINKTDAYKIIKEITNSKYLITC
jgi:hypothetical protein